MKPDAYRELKVLEELSNDSSITQRRLAQKLEVALGLTNLMIRRLVRKGSLKVVSVRSKRIQYLLTPQGIAEKSRLTYEYLQYSLFMYRRVREVLRAHLEQVAASGGRRVVLFGVGEIAEIAYLTASEFGLQVAAIVDDVMAGTKFLGMPVQSADVVPFLQFDSSVISSLNPGFDALRRRLQELAVPEDKLLVIAHQRALIWAAQTGPAAAANAADAPEALPLVAAGEEVA